MFVFRALLELFQTAQGLYAHRVALEPSVILLDPQPAIVSFESMNAY
jgi:hypothetical protein